MLQVVAFRMADQRTSTLIEKGVEVGAYGWVDGFKFAMAPPRGSVLASPVRNCTAQFPEDETEDTVKACALFRARPDPSSYPVDLWSACQRCEAVDASYETEASLTATLHHGLHSVLH